MERGRNRNCGCGPGPLPWNVLGLLPEAMPTLVKLSEQLWFQARPTTGAGPEQGLSRLKGRLQVKR